MSQNAKRNLTNKLNFLLNSTIYDAANVEKVARQLELQLHYLILNKSPHVSVYEDMLEVIEKLKFVSHSAHIVGITRYQNLIPQFEDCQYKLNTIYVSNKNIFKL